jgi:hypothetical protein
MALQNAFYAMGQTDMARKLARFTVEEVGYTPSYTWWVTVAGACDYAILGQDDKVYEFLELAQKSRMPVWDPWLKDVPCFERFKDDPVYQETVRHFDDLRAELRERLPETLAEFGVSLQ